MPTLTPNYNLQKPIVNSPVDEGQWGTEWNSNADIIDAQMKANADAITAASASLASGNITATTPPANGFYLPTANRPTLSANGVEHAAWSQTGHVLTGTDGSNTDHIINKPGTGSGSVRYILQRNSVTVGTLFNDGTGTILSSDVGPLYLYSSGGTGQLIVSNTGTSCNNTIAAPGFVPTGAAGSLGTYMMAKGAGAAFNSTVAGSILTPCNANGGSIGTAQTGTWRCMGGTTSNTDITLWVRIA